MGGGFLLFREFAGEALSLSHGFRHDWAALDEISAQTSRYPNYSLADHPAL
jgi:hypothetical protein